MANRKLAKSSTAMSEASPIEPNKIFFIDGHYGLSQVIKIFDITDEVSEKYDPQGQDWFKKTLKIAKSTATLEPYLIVARDHWYNPNFTVHWPNSPSSTLASWKGGWTSASKNSILFPPDSTTSSHAITMVTDSYFKFRERFVHESIQFGWHTLNALSIRNFVLTTTIAGVKTEVGRFWQPLGQIKQGGLLIVDAAQVDPVIAVSE
jgi:hypothetical protein